MAQVSIVKKASVSAIVELSAVAAVSAQATALAPSPDAGAAFSVTMSGIVIGPFMLLSFGDMYLKIVQSENWNTLVGCCPGTAATLITRMLAVVAALRAAPLSK
ncbi:hypothetical protein Tco_0732550 [Tanacetum coccineum]